MMMAKQYESHKCYIKYRRILVNYILDVFIHIFMINEMRMSIHITLRMIIIYAEQLI
jgi:hypothetical protein